MKTPKTVLFGRVTIFGWGLDVRLSRRRLLTVDRRNRCAYVSCDGTPATSTLTLWGSP